MQFHLRFAALFFFSLGLILLYKQNWKWYLPIFGLAVSNKETAILLTVIYALYYYNQIPRKQYWQLLIIQAVIFIVIKTALSLIFANSPGHAIEWHLLRIWLSIRYRQLFPFDPVGVVPLSRNGLNIPLPRGINLVMIVLVGFLIFLGWRDKPRFLQQSLIIVPIFFVIGMFNGHIDDCVHILKFCRVYLLAVGELPGYLVNENVRKANNKSDARKDIQTHVQNQRLLPSGKYHGTGAGIARQVGDQRRYRLRGGGRFDRRYQHNRIRTRLVERYPGIFRNLIPSGHSYHHDQPGGIVTAFRICDRFC
jgi:hypothetical protein